MARFKLQRGLNKEYEESNQTDKVLGQKPT